MAALTETLTKQVGPLPVGAWVAIVGGGLGIAWYTSKRKSPVEEQINTGSPEGVGEGPGTPGFIPSPVPIPAPDKGYDDNEEWAAAAVSWLIQNNMGSPSAASIAIRKYIDGDMWSVAEDKMIRDALKALGPPPIIPIGGGVIPDPTKPPTPKPKPIPIPPPKPKPKPPIPSKTPPGVWVTVRPWPHQLSTLQGISKFVYGNTAGWTRIRSANWKGHRRPDGTLGMITNSDRLFAGWRLWVPK